MMKSPACLIAALFGVLAMNLSAEEQRTVLFQSENPKKPLTLAPGDHLDVTSVFNAAMPTHKYLRVIGGTAMPGRFKERGEEMFRQFEYLIDDSLDTVNVDSDACSLYLKGNGDDFERKAYRRVNGEQLAPDALSVSAKVKRAGFSVADSADFGVQIELFLKKEGRDKNDVYDTPDALLFMAIPSGSGPFTEITQTFTLPGNVAAAVVSVGGRRFSGECWVESPRLVPSGKPAVQMPYEKELQRADTFNYWVGVNLVTRNWPVWNLSLDGKTVFEKAMFDRASNVADFFIPLPGGLEGSVPLRLTLVRNPIAASFPYEVRAVELIETPARDFEVIHSPGYIAAGRDFGVLVETNKPNIMLSVNAGKTFSPAADRYSLGDEGLHVVTLHPTTPGPDAQVTFSDGTREETVALGQVIEKGDDGVYLSVGDDIYVDTNDPHFAEYFKWYVGQRIGNFMQFRPSYQWSGVRKQPDETLRHYLDLLEGLKMPYAWQVEGRTLAGKDINPTLNVLESPFFHGKQAHENDGGYYYWQHFLYKGFFSDMAARTRPFGGIFAKHRPIYTDHGTFIHYDPEAVTDMADGARRFVENLAYSRGESTRHTGPSALFRYFYQAGYQWLGAEQMYGPEETIMSSLRGASRAYHKDKYGSLHAMQWGSGPFTDPKHALRHYLSLAVAYMHGSSHMNTEDALWLDEYVNDRFSESGKAHAAAQQTMLDFIETHERRGRLTTGIAVIQGRNDGWKSFGRGPIWSQKGDKWAFNKACESFDLLKVFYPQNTMDGCGPDGWFTSTPHGPVDLLPIEADQLVLNRYKVIVFLGWNSYDEYDFTRLAGFVKRGGTLILTAAHLNAEVAPDKPPVFPKDDFDIQRLLGETYRNCTKKLVVSLGAGKVIYFPQPVYPIDKAIVDEYRGTMVEAALEANALQSERGWIIPDSHIGFTAWDKDARRTIYLLDVDWKSADESHDAVLKFGQSSFTVTARRGALETIHCVDGLALMPRNNTTDVLDITRQADGWHIRVQITEADSLRIFNATTGKDSEKTLAEAGMHEFNVD
jgi:hypothetical protein